MSFLNFSLQDYFFELNAMAAIVFVLIALWLLTDLIQRMRNMMKLSWHSSERAEFDESRVKTILVVTIVIWIVYGAGWIYAVLDFDIESSSRDFENAKYLFYILNSTIVVNLLALTYTNYRIKEDIKVIKKIVPEDQEHEQSEEVRHF